MHDVVRNFALLIASRDRHFFNVAFDKLLEWPQKDKLEQYSAIYLLQSEIPGLPATLPCPNLLSFVLMPPMLDPSLKIPNELFSTTKKLRVLDLTYLQIVSLPSSIQTLENLQTLCLDYCTLEDVSIIGKLKKLQVLSLMDSDIVQLPRELEELTCLRLLDLSNCTSLQVIPRNVLSKLVQLEDLRMGNSFVQWEDEGQASQCNNACLSELRALSNLVALDIHVIDTNILHRDCFSEKLERFRIFIGDGWDWSDTYETSKVLKLKLNARVELDGIKVLLRRTEALYVADLRINNILYELDGQGFPFLEHLHVQNCSGVQYIIDPMQMGLRIAFPRLETLSLDNLINLEKLCCGVVKTESCSSLRRLTVRNCNKLKKLFSFSVARGLVQLEEINVSSCHILEEVVAKEPGEDSNDEALMLTQLRSLTLENLPQFINFGCQLQLPSSSAGIEEILSMDHEQETAVPLFNREIEFPILADLTLTSVGVKKIWSNQLQELSPCFQNLTTLMVGGCANLNHLFTSYVVQRLVQLKKLEVCECKSMVVVTTSHGNMESNFSFPMLESLKLKGLSNLLNFCTGRFIECPSLKTLWIETCPQLKAFISEVASNSQFGHADWTLFDEKVMFPKLEELTVMRMPELKMIWCSEILVVSFSKLKLLRVEHNCNLSKVFPPEMLRGFQNLESLSVENCDQLEDVFDLRGLMKERGKHVTTIQLRTLNIKNLTNLKHVWNEDPQGILLFDNLSSVVVWNCPRLSNVFPTSIAMNLPHLEQLEVDNCGVEEIISKEENSEASPTFMFHQLMHLKLWRLKNLKCFYDGTQALEFPMLKRLDVFHCNNLDSLLENIEDQQLLVFSRKVISNLEELSLSSKDFTVLRQGQYPANFFHKLKSLQLQCFHDPSSSFPFDLLQKFPNLEKLFVVCSLFQELFPYDVGSKEEHVGTLPSIRSLCLVFLPEMTHLWNQEPQIDQLLQNLETLEVGFCGSLITLAPYCASFKNLTSLVVFNCQGLVNIFTSSTAKEMVNLTRIQIEECSMVTEIIASDEDDPQNEIIFKKLSVLKLGSLRGLSSFSSANCSIKFPSLQRKAVVVCPNMTVFAQGVFSAPKLQKVYVTLEGEKWHWVNDLNTTIRHLYQEMGTERSG